MAHPMNHIFQMGDHLRFETVVFGCGNPLFGDDGFGPAVIEYLLEHCTLPDSVVALDVGTAIREFLIDILLSDRKPSRMLIVDAMDIAGARVGEIQEIDISAIQPAKIHDFSLHQFPTTNLLKELQANTDLDIRVLVVQPSCLPQTVAPGLSREVRQAVAHMADRVLDILQNFTIPAHEGRT